MYALDSWNYSRGQLRLVTGLKYYFQQVEARNVYYLQQEMLRQWATLLFRKQEILKLWKRNPLQGSGNIFTI